MSLFRDENPVLGAFILDRVGKPFPVNEGHIWMDVAQRALSANIGGVVYTADLNANVNITPVTGPSNVTTEVAMMSFNFPAQSLNVVGKQIYLWAAGLYSTAAAQTPTITYRVRLGGLTGTLLASFATTAVAASTTNQSWNLELFAGVVSKGATATFEAHGILDSPLVAAAGAAVSSFNDTNTAVSAAVDLTAAQLLVVTAQMSTAAAGNSVSQRQMSLEISN